MTFVGLKKVTDDMKTHKNPTLRQGPKPFKASAPQTAPKPSKPVVPPPAKKKPAVFELQDKRWAIVSFVQTVFSMHYYKQTFIRDDFIS